MKSSDTKLPLKSNFYSVIEGQVKQEISDAFQKHGWTIRKSSKAEFEFQNSWAELVLETDNETLLLHGLVAYHPENVKIIKNLFDILNCPYKFEFYDDNNQIIEQSLKKVCNILTSALSKFHKTKKQDCITIYRKTF